MNCPIMIEQFDKLLYNYDFSSSVYNFGIDFDEVADVDRVSK